MKYMFMKSVVILVKPKVALVKQSGWSREGQCMICYSYPNEPSGFNQGGLFDH